MGVMRARVLTPRKGNNVFLLRDAPYVVRRVSASPSDVQFDTSIADASRATFRGRRRADVEAGSLLLVLGAYYTVVSVVPGPVWQVMSAVVRTRKPKVVENVRVAIGADDVAVGGAEVEVETRPNGGGR